jgi:hypothetical protein
LPIPDAGPPRPAAKQQNGPRSGRTALSGADRPSGGEFAAADVDLQLAGVLGEPPHAQGQQADRAALRASIAPAGQTLVPQPRRCVVDNAHMPAPLARNLELEAGGL